MSENETEKKTKRKGLGRGKHTRAEEKKIQETYVEARVNGATQVAAREQAGYHPSYKNELPGSEARQRIIAELKKRGIDENFIANEFVDGITTSKAPGARDLDLNSHGNYLKQLGWILGYGRKDSVPPVAVQINNNTGPHQELDSGSIAELARLVEAEIRNRESDGVHVVDTGDEDAAARPGVGEAPGATPSPSGGGGA